MKQVVFGRGEAGLREIDKKAVEASGNAQALSCFILEYEPYILNCASKTAKRYITKSDDEWSVALEAFCNAVMAYSYEKGSFFSFASLMIRRRLIDYFRLQKKHRPEFSVDPCLFSGESEETGEDLQLASEIAAKTSVTPELSLKDEIEAANLQFSAYGFSFYDLIRCSPKSQKTKTACHAAVACLLSNPILTEEMRRSKTLPLKIMEQHAKVPRKLLERHRKYIIAVVEIIMGDYPGLSGYMKSFGEDAFR